MTADKIEVYRIAEQKFDRHTSKCWLSLLTSPFFLFPTKLHHHERSPEKERCEPVGAGPGGLQKRSVSLRNFKVMVLRYWNRLPEESAGAPS